MKIGFFAPAAPGHLYPTTALARKLQSRGHEVVIISMLDADPIVRASGLPFIPCCEATFPRGAVAGRVGDLSRLEGEEASRFTFHSLAAATKSWFQSFPATLEKARVDCLVMDTAQLYAELVPMYLGMPYVHISNALYFDCSGNTPLCLYDWAHKTDEASVERNRAGVENFRTLLESHVAAAWDFAGKVGLAVDWSNPNATISQLGWITQVPREFDFDAKAWPANFHHTGPFHDGAGRIQVEFPWHQLTGQPMVYASMGTLQNGLPHVFRAIASAARTHKELQFVISIGNHLRADQIGRVPSNTIVVRSTPQLEILKRARLCITHAGLNTTLEALTQGVPLIGIPVTNDQPGVAARIANRRVGLFVPSTEVTGSSLSSLIGEIMSDSYYHENARRLQHAIRRKDGLAMAADRIESAFCLADPSLGAAQALPKRSASY